MSALGYRTEEGMATLHLLKGDLPDVEGFDGELSVDNMRRLLAEITRLEDVVTGLERDIRGWAARYAELGRDKEGEARESELWPEAERLFGLWRRLTGRSGCKFSYDRFALAEGFLRKDGFDRCAQAIIGRVFDHYTGTRANGTTIHYHEWERIFGGQANSTKPHRGSFEESANRAPANWRERMA